ncbi:sensor histidine kinase [Streptomyces sp. NPDC002845]
MDEPAEPRSRRLAWAWARALAVAGLLLLVGLDMLIAIWDGEALWLQVVVVLPVGLTAVLWPARKRPAWLSPAVRTGVPAGLSLALTVTGLFVWKAAYGPGEVALLLCLLLVAVRTCPAPWAAVCGVLNGVAILAMPSRGDTAGYDLTLLVLAGATAGLGGYLRTLDHRRGVAVTETRRAERLAMAADLHDFVAHHVTGILVQTQLAQMLAATEPDRLPPILKNVEHASTEALASMRRTVGLLRETPRDGAGPEPGDHRPSGGLAALPKLVEDFGAPVGPKAVLRHDPAVPDDLPHEVQTAAYRVVQEALTNVRRHAADATEVTVDLTHDGHALVVRVRNDGRGGSRLPAAARGGGFGLVGLTERVTALGGELRAGPCPGQGWEITAMLPTESSATA